MAVTVDGGSRERASGPSPFDLDGAGSTGGSRRMPEVLLGTLLVVLCALGGVWFYATSTASDSFVALRNDIQRGDVVTREDLTVYPVSTDAPLRAIPVTDLSLIVGKISVADQVAGTIVTPEQFVDTSTIPEGYGVVGLSLSLGEYPSLATRPGDRVRVLAVFDEQSASVGDGLAGIPRTEVLAESVEVAEVSDSGAGKFIALVLEDETADLVAAAHAVGAVRLVMVPQE